MCIEKCLHFKRKCRHHPHSILDILPVYLTRGISGPGGYYLPGSREEVAEFINSMSNRAKNTFKAVKAAREYLKQIDGQQALELEEKGR